MTTNLREDRERVRRILDGDVDAFSEIVERWQAPLVNLAFRYCRDEAVAEELAQEAFLKIYRSLGRWRGDAALSTWMFAVAMNVYRSWARRFRPPMAPLDDVAAGLAAPGAAADAVADSRDLAERVRAEVLALPPRYRDALILFYFREMDLRSAAAILGLAEGTLKSQLHRARKLLARRLPDWADMRAAGTESATWTESIEFSSLNES